MQFSKISITPHNNHTEVIETYHDCKLTTFNEDSQYKDENQLMVLDEYGVHCEISITDFKLCSITADLIHFVGYICKDFSRKYTNSTKVAVYCWK